MTKALIYIGRPTASSAAIYSSDNATTSIFSATACNPTASPETLEMWLVPNGGTVGDDSKLYDAISVPANTQLGLELLINITMPSGYELHAQSSTVNTITVQISGDVT